MHGTGGSLEDFGESITSALARDFEVIAIDRPGHGYSSRPVAHADTPLDQARLVHRVLKSIGRSIIWIVGHSWSGALALAYALSARYAKLASPVIVLTGIADRFIDPQNQSLRFAREQPTASLIPLTATCHQVPMVWAEAVVDAIRRLAASPAPTET